MQYRLDINDVTWQVDVPSDMPLLWILRDELGLIGTKYGCGKVSAPEPCQYCMPVYSLRHHPLFRVPHCRTPSGRILPNAGQEPASPSHISIVAWKRLNQ